MSCVRWDHLNSFTKIFGCKGAEQRQIVTFYKLKLKVSPPLQGLRSPNLDSRWTSWRKVQEACLHRWQQRHHPTITNFFDKYSNIHFWSKLMLMFMVALGNMSSPLAEECSGLLFILWGQRLSRNGDFTLQTILFYLTLFYTFTNICNGLNIEVAHDFNIGILSPSKPSPLFGSRDLMNFIMSSLQILNVFP